MEHLYKSLIRPILLFTSDIWGIYNTKILEKAIRKFYKVALKGIIILYNLRYPY